MRATGCLKTNFKAAEARINLMIGHIFGTTAQIGVI
jgi:hypothetical protein